MTIRSTPAGTIIGHAPDDENEFDAIIDGNTQDGDKMRWFYGWKRAYLTEQSYDGWQPIEGGLSGDKDNTATRAYNRAENINAATGITGVGLTFPLATSAGIELKPIPDGSSVVIERKFTTDGKVAYWIKAAGAANGADGPCDT